MGVCTAVSGGDRRRADGFTVKNLLPSLYLPLTGGDDHFRYFPLIYTVAIGFTNYSARNLLDEERVTQHHLDKTYL